MAYTSAKLVMNNVDFIRERTEKGIRVVIKSLINSGISMNVAGTSRPASGSEHLFSHALDLLSLKFSFTPALHGEQCGVGTIITTYLQGGNWKKVKKLLAKIGLPTNSEEMGIEPRYIIEALVSAKEIRPDRYTVLHSRKLTKKTAETVATKIGVI